MSVSDTIDIGQLYKHRLYPDRLYVVIDINYEHITYTCVAHKEPYWAADVYQKDSIDGFNYWFAPLEQCQDA